MKGNLNGKTSPVFLITLVLWITCFNGRAQQNNTMFFMHSLPEANFVNPAVQGKCGVFIGLPLVSSFHMNIANSGFTAGNVMTVYTDGTTSRNPDFNTGRLAGMNYFLTEFHSTLLAVGLQRNDLYYTFTVTEKNNATAMYTRDLVTFILRGDPEFEGKHIVLSGMNISLNHYREYALGISKKYSDRLTLGIKAKVLFGIFNFTTGKSSFDLYVEENTNNIVFDMNGGYSSSLPYSMRMESPGIYRFYHLYNASMMKHLMNIHNPGIALDFGFIYKYNNDITFSGSLLDLGLIFYRSNLTNYAISGTHTYNGPFGAGMITDQYLWDVFDELNQNMTAGVAADPYRFMLSPRLYLGAAYKWNKRFNVNMLLYNRFLPHKLQTGATVALLTRPSDKLEASLSWSYMNRSFTNLGFGLSYGNKPLQLYFVSDNILGFILPLSTKNVNLRLGLNLFFGCREKFNIDQCGCEWLRNTESHRLRKEEARRKKRR